jgi:hypothetical protein
LAIYYRQKSYFLKISVRVAQSYGIKFQNKIGGILILSENNLIDNFMESEPENDGLTDL